MPIPSYAIMQETRVIRKEYLEQGKYEASSTTDLVDDHIDNLKSQYYGAEEYYEQVVKRINMLLEMDTFSEESREAMTRILTEVVLPHQERFLEQKRKSQDNE